MNQDKYDQWLAESAESAEYEVAEIAQDFAVGLDEALIDADMTRSALAEQVGCSPSYITKVLRGDANFTIETMVKLTRAVGYKVHLHMARRDHHVAWREVIHGVGASKPNMEPAVVHAWVNRKPVTGPDNDISAATAQTNLHFPELLRSAY